MSPALAIEEAVVFILSCRTLLWPYENSVSDSEFCIFFFFCDTKSSERIKRDVTGDLGSDRKGTKKPASPVAGVRMSGEHVGNQRVSPISGKQWAWRELELRSKEFRLFVFRKLCSVL